MTAPLRLGVCGAGRVFERLYLPALRSVPAIQLVGIADPVTGRCALAGPGVAPFASFQALLDGARVDAVAVLSPPASHTADAVLALERGLPVLVEKPLCPSLTEADRLRAAGADALLTPALSRRYWPAYQRLAARRPIRDLRLAIAVNPAGWGAHSGPTDLAQDLFPHIADLARWLTASDVESLTARAGARGLEARLEMANGAQVSARLDQRQSYQESARADGRSSRVGPPGAMPSLARRALRREDPPVQAVAAMLQDWSAAIHGVHPPVLPRFADGVATVAVMERLRSALGR